MKFLLSKRFFAGLTEDRSLRSKPCQPFRLAFVLPLAVVFKGLLKPASLSFQNYFSFKRGERRNNSWKKQFNHLIFHDPKETGGSSLRRCRYPFLNSTLNRMLKIQSPISNSFSQEEAGLGTSSKANGKTMIFLCSDTSKALKWNLDTSVLENLALYEMTWALGSNSILGLRFVNCLKSKEGAGNGPTQLKEVSLKC